MYKKIKFNYIPLYYNKTADVIQYLQLKIHSIFKKESAHPIGQTLFLLCRHYLFFRAASSQVSSAQMSLTTVFGMGTGGPSLQSTPTHETLYLVNARDILTEQITKCKHFFHFFSFFTFLTNTVSKKFHFKLKSHNQYKF